MNNSVKRKLLILGANAETIPLVHAAQSMGVHVGVTDFNPMAPAKKYADSMHDVDGVDVNALVSLVEEENYDGVLVGVADRLIEPYRQVCERLGLPCYASEKQCKVLTDKLEFDIYCHKFNIKTIPSYTISQHVSDDEIAGVEFPLLVKPVDANSGKGMRVCRNVQELRQAINRALIVSRKGRYLVERYMECEDILIYFTFKDGEYWISAVGDRYTYRNQDGHAPVCSGAIYPSKYTCLCCSSLQEPFFRLFSDIGISNGVLLVSAFVEGKNIYVYDPGFRLQGEAPNLHLAAINDLDHCQMLIQFALSGSMGIKDIDSLNDVNFDGNHAATIWFLLRKGVIHSVNGLDDVRRDDTVHNVVQRLYPGDVVTAEMEGTEAQVFARVYLCCETRKDLLQAIRRIDDMVSVVGPDGESLVLRPKSRWFDSTHI